MKTIGIMTNREKDEDLKYTKLLVEFLLLKNIEINISYDILKELKLNSAINSTLDDDAVLQNSEVIICLGGDGTFLRVARHAYIYDKPILGINLGTLGFLTEVDKNDIKSSIEKLLSGEYRIEERMMLEATIMENDRFVAQGVALNDVVVSRVALSRILHLNTYINNQFMDSFPGDGLIISSPTGSTAYSLSAGGPIVEPDVEMMIITPICPHILYTRSFVTSGERVVKVIVGESFLNNAMVTLDGQKGYRISGGYSIEIKKSPHTVKIIQLNNRNFFHILRTKIYDRGENLRQDEI